MPIDNCEHTFETLASVEDTCEQDIEGVHLVVVRPGGEAEQFVLKRGEIGA